MAAAHCASTSSAFLGLPRGNGRRRNSCRFVANARLVPVSATLDKETAAAKPRRSRNRRSRKATKSESTALLAADEPAEAKNGGAPEEAANGGGGRGMVALDDVIVNPVGLGRRSRQVFDEVWRKFSRLGQMSSASSAAVAEQDPAVLFRGGPMCEFTVPGAQDITVLVVGATSRIGRIVVRKLMLRGYNVKTLVRRNDPEVIDMLPRSVDIVVGDVGDPSSVQAAVSGCNKVIYCATARSTITGDLNRVDNQGVRNVTKAFQDYYNQLAQSRAGKSSKSKLTIAKFKSAKSVKGWEVRQGSYFQDIYPSRFDGGTDASFEYSERGQAVFSGFVFTRGGYVEMSKRLSLPLGSTLDRYDGLLLSVGGNGRSYVIILETGPLADTSQTKKYFARMNTKSKIFCFTILIFFILVLFEQNDYYNMMKGPVEPQLQFAIKTLSAQNQQNQQNPQVSRQIASSSGYGTMIPTPGMTQSTSGNSRIPYVTDNNTLSSSGSTMVPQNANMGASMPGSMSNGYQHLNNTIAQNSTPNSIQSTMGSVGVQRQLPHMIPTPGFSNQQSVPANPDYSNGTVYFNGESAVAPHMQHQKQFSSNQNSNQIQHIGSHSNSGIHSSMLDNSSAYGLSDGHMNGGIGLHGSNMQLTNRTSAPEAYMNISNPYGNSPKPLQQQFNQHPQQRIPTSVDMSGSGSFYAAGSTPLTTANSQSMNVANLQSRSRVNPMLVNNQLNIQSIQPQSQIKTEVLDQPEKVNFQSSQLTQDQLLCQHSMPHQVQPNSQFVQNHYHINQQQLNPQHQQAMLRSNSFKQSQMASSHSMQLSEQGTLPHTELVSSQASDPVDLPSFPGQYQQRNALDNVKGGQMFGNLSGSQNFHASASHVSQQLLPSNPQLDDGSNDVSYGLKGSQADQMLRPQWQPQTMEKAPMTTNSSLEKQIHEDFCQRTMTQDGAQQPFSSDWRLSHCTVTSIDPAVPKPTGGGFEQVTGNIHYLRQIRWLLLLFHAKSCTYPVGSCKFHGCVQVQELLKHFQNCQRKDCSYRSCSRSKMVFHHYKTCVDEQCPVCSIVRKFLRQSTEQASKQKALESRKLAQQNVTQRIMNGVEGDRMDVDPVSAEVFDDLPSVPKRLKMQPPSPSAPENDICVTSNPHVNPGFVLQETQPEQLEHSNRGTYLKREIDAKADMRAPQKPIKSGYSIDGNVTTRHNPSAPNDMNIKQENLSIDKVTSETAIEVKNETNDPADATVSKSGKPKIKGVSLTELFTPEQIKEHIDSLRLWVGQSKAKAEKNQAIGHSENENSCQLCRVEKLTFEPPPIYCSPCGARIKRNAPYYTVGTGDTRHYFCIPCYNESRGETIEVEGQTFSKANLEKKRNDEETEEWWVQCDKCECWQHQICALFNGRRNDGGQAEYTCPNCYVEEVKCGLRKPLPQSAVLGAKDLPRTVLSDHIEDRLFKRLKKEKQDRAAAAGKNIDEIPGAEGLVVRVVSSVDKKLEVKPRFMEIYGEDNYPQEFPYKSKAVLLFQKIEGVEVCLFGMYVQEFGAECSFPNQRRVYLSYLDSVKYFRPEIKTVSGEALRTFVYHEILIGYLEYCKLRGFTSCYIWACPPLKGEDYILYCHPEIQKTPKSDKLREWYLSMLRKASKEEIVVELTNLYDHFFITMGECKAKVTAARLPYFDGDYWPGAAEDMISQLRQEEDDRKLQKKSKTKKIITKRALKAAGQTDLSGNASKDAMLMQKLGETIYPMKEDFIMVHLQYSCCHCCVLMVSGRRWVCHQCRSFYICDKCYDAEQQLEDRERHPSNSRDTHMLHPVDIIGVPKDTKDRDDILESEFFDTRQAFLSLCQGNHYQYDTLRRAKHSSMMVLYHLHNPTAPAFVTTCNVCCHDIETGQGWRCEVCPDFDVCNACFQKGAVNHPHNLTNHPSAADRDAQNAEARQMRVQQLRKMLDLLVHASTCRSGSCQYPNCRKVKGLFRHGMQCKTRASGGCVLCKKMWYMLQLHARACKDSECNVPRCRDLKEHLRRLQQQSDSRRRAAVNEMMRQRAAEVAANE